MRSHYILRQIALRNRALDQPDDAILLIGSKPTVCGQGKYFGGNLFGDWKLPSHAMQVSVDALKVKRNEIMNPGAEGPYFLLSQAKKLLISTGAFPTLFIPCCEMPEPVD